MLNPKQSTYNSETKQNIINVKQQKNSKKMKNRIINNGEVGLCLDSHQQDRGVKEFMNRLSYEVM